MDGCESEFQRTNFFSLLQARREFLLNSEKVQLARVTLMTMAVCASEEQALHMHKITPLRHSFRDRIKPTSGHPTKLWGALISTQHPSELPACKSHPLLEPTMTCHQSSSATRSFQLSSRNNFANFSQSMGSLGMLERAVASFGDCMEDNSSGLRNLSLPETHPCLAGGEGSNNSCCLQPEFSAHAAATGLHCAETAQPPAAFPCLPMP